jgi:hypothetical protein
LTTLTLHTIPDVLAPKHPSKGLSHGDSFVIGQLGIGNTKLMSFGGSVIVDPNLSELSTFASTLSKRWERRSLSPFSMRFITGTPPLSITILLLEMQSIVILFHKSNW